ncbi:MAG: hypothetical protein IJA84_00135 [Clostridia bacterium]|nr:hypothetical protein [Clostridia bacterium]
MKRFFALTLALMLCLALFACGKQPAQTPPADDPPPVEVPPVDPPAQDPVTPPEEPVPADPLPGEQVSPEVPEVTSDVASVQYKDDSGEVLVMDIQVELPIFEGLPQINDYYQSRRDDLVSTYQLNLDGARQQQAADKSAGIDFIPWGVWVNHEITRNDGVTLSVMYTVRERWSDQDVILIYGDTFDTASQGRLLLGDLFQPEADYLSRLPVEEVGQMNFALTDDNLVLCLSDTVTVPLSDLSDILLPQYVTE